jgi:hypothetical protein
MQPPFPAALDRSFGNRSADRCLALQLAGELSRQCRHGPRAWPARPGPRPGRPGWPGPASPGRLAGPGRRRGEAGVLDVVRWRECFAAVAAHGELTAFWPGLGRDRVHVEDFGWSER